jgi:pimeloyl-ACP methyl ester carboxylesterase
MPLADAGYRVVTWDAPGHGANPGRLSSLPEMIDAVVAAVRTAGPVAGVVAHSVGAAAVTGALARGSLVERAVFLAPPAEPGAYLALAGAWLGLPPAIAERARRRIERRFSVRMDDLAPLAQAPRMTTPLVVVHDHEDHEVPWRDGRRLAAAWPGARLVSTRGLGHRRPLRDPTVIGTAVEFLSPAPSRLQEPSEPRPAVPPVPAGARSSLSLERG